MEYISAQPNLAPQEPQAPNLVTLQNYLDYRAHAALVAPSFSERNAVMADVVANESAVLATYSLHNDGHPAAAQTFDALNGVFHRAAVDAGAAFEPAFNAHGRKQEDQSGAFDSATNAAGGVALAHLPEALRAAGLQVRHDVLVNGTVFEDIVRLTARQLGVAIPQDLSEATVRTSLAATVRQDDSFSRGVVETLPFNPKVMPFIGQWEQALDVAVRLANVTWKAGQVHRAAWEGTDSRIDHETREVFNPYDLLKQEQYARIMEEGHSSDDAVRRVALDIWKDMRELQSAAQPVGK